MPKRRDHLLEEYKQHRPQSAVPPCALCGRPLGQKTEQHHIIPRAKGGKDTVPLHPICHKKIHKTFTNTQLVEFASLEPVKAHPEIEKYINWIAKRPPDFHRRTR